MTVSKLITGLPSRSMTQTVFDAAMAQYMLDLPVWATEVNATAAEVNANTVTATAQATIATAQAVTSVAAASASGSSAAAAAVSAATALGALSAPAYNDTSASNLTVGTGAKVFTITAGKSFGPGMSLKISSTASPTNSMTGTVTSYAGTTLTMNITATTGAGTFASWSIALTPLAIPGLGGSTGNTGNLTLSVTSGAMVDVNPASPGYYVTLPDATLLGKGAILYAIRNSGDFDYGVKDATGLQLGWVRARTTGFVGLAENVSSGGMWSAVGLEKLGVTATLQNFAVSSLMTSVVNSLVIDASRTLLTFGGSANIYGVIYDASTLTWGAITLIRASSVVGHMSVLSGASQALIAFHDATNVGLVTLTIAGTSFTVNTAITEALAVTFGTTSGGQLVAVGTSWVICYNKTTVGPVVRGITIAGTVPTLGIEVFPANAANLSPCSVWPATAATFFTVHNNSAQYATGYSIAGSTLTLGTQVNTAVQNPSLRQLVTGRVLMYGGTPAATASIISMAGTVPAFNNVTTSMTSTSGQEAVPITTTKICLFEFNSSVFNAQIINDTGGVPTVGALFTMQAPLGSPQALAGLQAVGNVAHYFVRYGTVAGGVVSLDCTGTAPVHYRSAFKPHEQSPLMAARNARGTRSPSVLVGGANAYSYNFTANNQHVKAVCAGLGMISEITLPPIYAGGNVAAAQMPGGAANENFCVVGGAGGVGATVQRVEAAA
jgi:hypothetical protein